MSELEERHAYWSGRDVIMTGGPYRGRRGYCLGPGGCFVYDVRLHGTGGIVSVDEADLETGDRPPPGPPRVVPDD